MGQVNHYISELRDVLFNLFELHDIGRTTLGQAPYDALNEDTARQAIEGLEKLCREELAKGYFDSDRNPPVFEDGKVTLPESTLDGINAYYDGGWHLFEQSTALNGFNAPPSLNWAVFEFLAGSHSHLVFYLLSNTFARVIEALATPEQKKRYLPHLLERRWGSAMVLTEPDAGSDVGSARASAKHVQGDEWHITGTKRFITNGEYEGTENIIHLVLARPEGAVSGTKGLSMFIVPKVWVEADGSLGERNGFKCVGLEHKMGLKGSVTCEMVYGEDTPCRGLLVGNVHDGIRQMFQVIEQARMAVGIRSLATLSTAYQHALRYARERIQGPDLTRIMDKTSPRVRIIEHPDVRRMLMSIKAHVHGMRALAIYTATIQDQVGLRGGHGAPEAKGAEKLNNLLLPLVKGYSSDRTWGLLSDALQVFGGAGYTQDVPLELYIRDQKIDTLYEGTTHIQSLDLIFRKVARDGGQTLQRFLGKIGESLANEIGGEDLATERAALAEALENVQMSFGALLGKSGESFYHVGLHANRMLHALAEVTMAWLLTRQAAIAASKIEDARGDDVAFYQSKVAVARWFCRNVLPQIAVTRRLVESSTLELMELPEACF